MLSYSAFQVQKEPATPVDSVAAVVVVEVLLFAAHEIHDRYTKVRLQSIETYAQPVN